MTSSYGIFSFSYLAAISWNSLPDHHLIISDFTSFRRLLSTGYNNLLKGQELRGGSRGGVEGVATPPLSSFFLLLLFCLILPKNNRIKLFLRSYFTFTIRLLVKLWKDNVHFAKVVSGSGILKQATWTGDIHWKVNEGDWDRPNAWVSLKWVQRLTENEENNRLLCKEIR